MLIIELFFPLYIIKMHSTIINEHSVAYLDLWKKGENIR